MPAITPEVERVRDEQDASRLRRQRDRLLHEAEIDDLVTPFIGTEVWTEVLLPLLETQMRDFLDAVWICKEEDFGKVRAQALRSKEIRDYFLEHNEKRDSYIEMAKKITAVLDGATKAGRISHSEEGK